MDARLLLLSLDCPAVAGGRRSPLPAGPRVAAAAPRARRPRASSVRASAATAARGYLPHHASVAGENGGPYTVGDFMTKREELHVVKPTTSVDEAVERLVEHRITGFPVIDDDWNLVGVVSDYDLLALDLISGNGQAEADIFPEVDSTWKDLFYQNALDVQVMRCWTLMEAQYAKKSRRKDAQAFLDLGMVNEVLIRDCPGEIDDYVFNAFVKLQHKTHVVLQYAFDYHWILVWIALDKSKIVIIDSLDKGPKKLKPLIDLLNRAFRRYCKKSVWYAPFKKEFSVRYNFPILS